jgi:preprotein translocase subunit YajC
MSFFISDAFAQAAPQAAQQASPWTQLPIFIVLFAVFYFLLIRPQQKRAKEHKKLVDNLAKGDEVVTQGGLLGRVTEVGENFIEVEIASDVKVKVQRPSVVAVMPKGTIKSL